MDGVAAWRLRLRSTRARVIGDLAGIEDAALEQPWTWPWRQHGHADQLRFALLRLADEDEDATIRIGETLAALGWRHAEPQRILGLAEISCGWLLGELVGVPDDLLDRAPAPGEWPLRQALAHVLVSERFYYQRTVWHIAEARAGRPTRGEPPAGVVEPLSEADHDTHGTVAAIIERLAAVREETWAALADCAVADLATPSKWYGYDVDVRFRLHRFAAHERQHTVQVAKTLRGVGFAPTEAQRLLGQAQMTRGHLLAQLVGLPDELLDRAAPATPSIAAILAA